MFISYNNFIIIKTIVNIMIKNVRVLYVRTLKL